MRHLITMFISAQSGFQKSGMEFVNYLLNCKFHYVDVQPNYVFSYELKKFRTK